MAKPQLQVWCWKSLMTPPLWNACLTRPWMQGVSKASVRCCQDMARLLSCGHLNTCPKQGGRQPRPVIATRQSSARVENVQDDDFLDVANYLSATFRGKRCGATTSCRSLLIT